MSKTLVLTEAEHRALELLVLVGSTGLTTSVGPGQTLKRRIETKHGKKIEIEDITSVLAKLSDDATST